MTLGELRERHAASQRRVLDAADALAREGRPTTALTEFREACAECDRAWAAVSAAWREVLDRPVPAPALHDRFPF